MIIGHHHPGLGGCQRVLIDGHRGTTGHWRSCRFFGGGQKFLSVKILFSQSLIYISQNLHKTENIRSLTKIILLQQCCLINQSLLQWFHSQNSHHSQFQNRHRYQATATQECRQMKVRKYLPRWLSRVEVINSALRWFFSPRTMLLWRFKWQHISGLI